MRLPRVSLALFAFAAIAPAPTLAAAQTPRLQVAAPATTVATYDSLYHVTATPYDVLGRRSPRSTISWRAWPQGAIAIVPDTLARGQVATIAGTAPGESYAIAIWRRSDGVVVRDSVRITVRAARIVAVKLFTSFHATADGRVVGSVDPLTVGQARCVYVVDLDRRGGVQTGRAVQNFQSTDPRVASFGLGGAPLACPDTSINPAIVLSWQLSGGR